MTCISAVYHFILLMKRCGWSHNQPYKSVGFVLGSLESKAPVYYKFGCPPLVHLNERECFIVSLAGHKAGQLGLVKRKGVGPLPNKLWYSSVDM